MATISRSSHLQVLSIKGQGSADQRVEDDPETPHINFWSIVLLSLEKFWSSIRRGATESVQFTTHSELVAEAEVGDLDVHICI